MLRPEEQGAGAAATQWGYRFGMLAASRLPKLHHPIFEAGSFARASRDRFVICIEAADPAFDAAAVRRTFEQLGAERSEEVRA